MKKTRRGACALLAALLMTAAALTPAWAAQPLADLRIDASAKDFPQRLVSIRLYRPGEDGGLALADTVQRTCTLNRVTGDASFYIQPGEDGVQVAVDCLTDVDGDGIYELVDDDAAQSLLVPQQSLALQPGGEAAGLVQGQTYVLSAEVLVRLGQEAAQARMAGILQTPAGAEEPTPGLPLYQVSLLPSAQEGGAAQPQVYYLKIFDEVLIPDDVTPSDWYYSAVEFALARGYLAGTGDGTFAPGLLLDRAQLAQILWRMGGSLEAPGVSFADVSPEDWYYSAVSWCCREQIMAGMSAARFGADQTLTREQLALILCQYAGRYGTSAPLQSGSAQLSDWDLVSPWARTGVDWAVSTGLLSPDSTGALNPAAGVTRAEMAVVLHRLSGITQAR